MPTFPSSIRSKLPKTGTTIFTVMSKLAQDHDAINLSQGFPDFSSSGELIRLVKHYMTKGLNQYAPMPGVLELRQAIAQKIKSLYRITFDPADEVTVTAGATQGIYAAITAVVQEGDEVIIFEPAYDCYEPAIRLNGGIPVYVPLEAPSFKVDWEQVKKRISGKTKLIIINTPHNPTGSIMTKSDMEQLEKLIDGTDILLLSDEVYEHIIFDKEKHQSVLCFPKLAKRSFVVYSFGKTYHNTGWKMGYCVAPGNLMAEFRKVHQFIVFSCNTPIQYALAEFMQDEEQYLGLSAFYQEKRDFFNDLVKESRFRLLPSKGTYFQLLGYESITDEKDTDYAIRLTKEVGVAAIPVSVFYHQQMDNKVLRFCFAKSERVLKRAAKLLCEI